MPICRKCGVSLSEGMIICTNCGTAAGDNFCKSCGAVLIAGKICGECGALAGTGSVKPVSFDSASSAFNTTLSSQNIPAFDTPNSRKNFIYIKSGFFRMGSSDNEPKRNDDEGPQNHVNVSSFYMCKYQVTQKEYQEVMKKNPSSFKGDNLPVEMVCWYDAIEYCNRLSLKEGLTPAYSISGETNPDNWGFQGIKWDSAIIVPNSKGYRLPTEAQWEYACRAGTATPFSTGNNITSDQANFDGSSPYNNNAAGVNLKKTTPVGSFPANPWGLHDMHGNVWEWCWDWKENYNSGMQIDPTGPVTGKNRAERGGSWCSGGHNLRSACRSYDFPSIRGHNDGFRVVLPE